MDTPEGEKENFHKMGEKILSAALASSIEVPDGCACDAAKLRNANVGTLCGHHTHFCFLRRIIDAYDEGSA